MNPELLTAETEFRVEFYDVDSMQIVWHGNYIKYFELGRCVLLDRISFGYREMAETGYAWPVVDIGAKFIRPLAFRQRAIVKAKLIEYENRLKIAYTIRDAETEQVVTKGQSTQIALEVGTQETCFVSPPCLIEKVEAVLYEMEAKEAIRNGR